jgi:hypothetical protein
MTPGGGEEEGDHEGTMMLPTNTTIFPSPPSHDEMIGADGHVDNTEPMEATATATSSSVDVDVDVNVPHRPVLKHQNETEATSSSEDDSDNKLKTSSVEGKETNNNSSKKNCFGQTAPPPADDAAVFTGYLERASKNVARNPCAYLWTSMIIGIALSAVAMIVGEFAVSAETNGWNSRGTIIADRQTQVMLAVQNSEFLFNGGPDAWDYLLTTVQPGWETDGTDDDDDDDDDDDSTEVDSGADRRRRLTSLQYSMMDYIQLQPSKMSSMHNPRHSSSSTDPPTRQLPFVMTPELKRRLQDAAAAADDVDGNNTVTATSLANCDVSFYESSNLTSVSRLWPIWKTTTASSSSSDVDSILDAQILRDICIAEQNTQQELESLGLCFGCPDGKCLPPFSVVFYARLVLPDGFALDCDELAQAWTSELQQTTEEEWKVCVDVLIETYDPSVNTLPEECPFGFDPFLVPTTFHENMVVSYSSSIFATNENQIDELYAIADTFDRGTAAVTGAYDTQYEDFVNIYVDESLLNDMILACKLLYRQTSKPASERIVSLT